MPNQAAYPGHGFRGGSRMSRSRPNGHLSLPQQTLSSKQAGMRRSCQGPVGSLSSLGRRVCGCQHVERIQPSSLQVQASIRPRALVGFKSSNSGGWLEMTSRASARAQKGKIPFPLSLSSPGAYEQSFRWPPSPSRSRKPRATAAAGSPRPRLHKNVLALGMGQAQQLGGAGFP